MEPTPAGFDERVNAFLQPFADAISSVIFFELPILGASAPVVVLWLALAGLFFTVYLRFINIRGFPLALALVRGKLDTTHEPGEVSHFQALATAISGTVGIGNIGGVAIAISIGGPGAAVWIIVAGFLGMSSKLVECTLGVMYRRENGDGSVSGGPMYYLEAGLAERGLPGLGRALGVFYAVGIVVGCLGIGNMFQSNQAFVQLVNVTGGSEHSWLADKGWLVGLVIASMVGLVIVGGIRSIARVTARLVPFMAVLYLIGAATVIIMNREAIPFALRAMLEGAFQASGITGGAVGVLVIGFQRAVFSNEAGIGSATIAHSAVRTNQPITEGLVALLEPFIDTVVICTATALVVTTTMYYEPEFGRQGVGGVELTSSAFERNLWWSPYPLALVAALFAFSTMISWSYYGQKGWTYLVGHGRRAELGFSFVFCGFAALGCVLKLDAVLAFSDALVFVICVPNIFGLYWMAPMVKREAERYLREQSGV